MKSRNFLAILGLTGLMVAPLLAGCGSTQSSGSQAGPTSGSAPTSQTAQSYTVTYSKTAELYTIAGVENSYKEGETVTFTVTLKQPEVYEISSVSVDGKTLVPSGITYSFVMPGKNVQIVVATAKKASGYVLTATPTAPTVDETVTFTLMQGTNPVVDYQISGKTEADSAKLGKTNSPDTFVCLAEGVCNVVAKVGGLVKAEISLTIGRSSVMSIQDAKVAAFNNGAGNNNASSSGNTSENTYTVIGKVVYEGSVYNGGVELLLDDGTGIIDVTVKSSAQLNYKGKVLKVSSKIGNQYGTLQMYNVDPKYVTLSEKVITNTQAAVEMSGADFNAYAEAHLNQKNTTVHDIKHAKIHAVGAPSGTSKRFNVVGADAKYFNGSISCSKSEVGVNLECVAGAEYIFSGFFVSAGTSYYNFATYAQSKIDVTGVSFAETSVTVNKKGKLQLNPVYAPAGASPKYVQWKSNNENVVRVDENGVITGVAAGTAKVTVTVDYAFNAAIDVTVTDIENKATSLKIKEPTQRVAIGEPLQLETEITCVNPDLACTDEIIWISDNTSVARVDTNGVVTGVAEGRVSISAIINHDNLSSSITIEVISLYGTVDKPLSITEALAVGEKYATFKGDASEKYPFTEAKVTAKGVLVEYGARKESATGDYFTNVYLKDTKTGDKILVYSLNLTEGITDIDPNDELTVQGHIENYNGTIEFASMNVYEAGKKVGQDYVYIMKQTRGTSTVGVDPSSSAKAHVTNLSTTSGVNGSTFTFKVTVDQDYEITGVFANNTELTEKSGLYTGVIHGDTLIKVTAKSTKAVGYQEYATFDFSKLTKDDCGQGSEIKASNKVTLLQCMKKAMSNSSDDLVNASETKIYNGNGTGGWKQNQLGFLKTGTSSVAGKLVLEFKSGINIGKVVISAHAWLNTSNDTISVNDSVAQAASTTDDWGELTFVLEEATNKLTIDFNKRCFVKSIQLFVVA